MFTSSLFNTKRTRLAVGSIFIDKNSFPLLLINQLISLTHEEDNLNGYLLIEKIVFMDTEVACVVVITVF